MTRQWTTKCVQCGTSISYANKLAARAESIGKPRSVLCPKCAQLEARGLRATPAPQVALNLQSTRVGTPLGSIERVPSVHSLEDRASKLNPDKFGVTDSEIKELYSELLRDDTPVVIAVAPTGSGKSTFLPYRLLVPNGLPEDTFTGGRQIVITQPRRVAATGITGYVAGTLHGADAGVGHEIGYRVRGDVRCDSDNRMVYVTDGTLINWIVRGELDRISMIIIDEAHERSLNIDVIIGLLANVLPQYPHLKVMIVSATIDLEKFRTFFDRNLPGSMRCGVVECSGTKPVGLKVHYRNPQNGVLPYAKGTLRTLGKEIWQELADAMVRIIVEMDSRDRKGKRAIEPGDVLGFLHGAKPIQDACDRIEARLKAEHPALARNTDVYPLYAAVDDDTRKKAIDEKKDASRRRVVIASNAAETSLTIDSLVHVVESGFIKQTQWDPVMEQAPLLPIAHSQAGCRQRWGRVGRTMEGFTWTLYTKAQFQEIFQDDTTPEIKRSCLDGVVLLAKRAGADRLDAQHFPWLDAPEEEEITRSLKRLTRQGAIDGDGDLTATGVDIAFSGGEEAQYARLIADADRFGLGIEVATLIPFLSIGLSDLLPDDRDASPEIRRSIQEAQNRLKQTCADDLELCLRVYQEWSTVSELMNGASWKLPKLHGKLHSQINGGAGRVQEFQAEARKARSAQEINRVIGKFAQDPKAFQHWRDEACHALKRHAREDWARRHGIDECVIEDVARARADLIRELGAKKKELEDRDIDLSALDRLRVVVGRALPDAIFRTSSETLDRDPEESLYQPVSQESSDEMLLRVDRVSCCRLHPPRMLIALGPKRRLDVEINGEQSSALLGPFAIKADGQQVEDTIRLSDIELADYFREYMPRPAAGSAQDRRRQKHESIRQRFPIGVLVECRVQSLSTDGAEIEVVRQVGWGGQKTAPIRVKGNSAEKREHESEKGFDPRYGGGKKNNGRKNKTTVQAAVEDTYDPIEDAIAASTPESSSAPRSNTGTSKKPASDSVPGRLRQFGKADGISVGDTIRAEVTEHTEQSTQPGVLVVSPPRRDRFRCFCEHYQPGDDVRVEVLGSSSGSQTQQGLMVRDAESGLETVVAAEHMILFNEPDLLSKIPIGTSLQLRLESINRQYEDVQLSGLPLLETELQRVHSAKRGRTSRATVASINHDDRNIYMCAILENSQPDKGIIIPVKIRMYRELFEYKGELRIPYRVGDQLHVEVKSYDNAGKRSKLARPTGSESKALKKAGVEYGGDGRLRLPGRMTMQVQTKLLEASESPAFSAAVRDLFLSSSQPYGDRVITDLEQRFPVGKSVQGTVTYVNGGSIKLALKDGVTGRIAQDEISWWQARPYPKDHASVGDVLTVKVLRVDTREQAVDLSLKKVESEKDPWLGSVRKVFAPSKQFDGEVKNIQTYGVFVQFKLGLDGLIHIRDLGRYTRSFIEHPSDVVQVGDRVRVSVDEIDINKRKFSLTLRSILKKASSKDNAKSASKPAELNEASEVFQSWDTAWPWTDGENAIKKQKKPKPPEPPKARVRTPLEKRVPPADWALNW